MNHNDRILLFLGNMQAKIENLGVLAIQKKSPLFDDITDLGQYFNVSITDLFSEEKHE